MKTFKLLTFVTCLVLVCSVVSCSDDDLEIFHTKDLYGDYKRSDFTRDQQYELYLSERNENYGGCLAYTSGWCYYDEFEEGIRCLSIAYCEENFSWNVKYNILIIKYEDELEKFIFDLDDEGNLHFSEPNRLTDYKDLYFIKLR